MIERWRTGFGGLMGALMLVCVLPLWAQDAGAGDHAMAQAQVLTDLAASEKRDPNLRVLRRLLAQPDSTIDLAQAEVVIERMIDPKVDAKATLRALDALAHVIQARFPQGNATDPDEKVGLLLNSLQVAGPWNDQRPFHYDLDDPMGENPQHELLSTYLATRRGNCVSMPVLIVVLAQKLGIEATLSNAPAHVFARVRRTDGTWLNIEATSFGTLSDVRYQEQLNITPRAIQSGAYLASLSKRQEVLVMVDTLEQFYRHHRDPERLLGLTLLVLTADMTDVSGWLWRGNAYAALIDDRFIHKYGRVDAIPAAERAGYDVLHANNLSMFRRAEALGWVEETAHHRTDYLNTIEDVKARRAQQGERP